MQGCESGSILDSDSMAWWSWLRNLDPDPGGREMKKKNSFLNTPTEK
jgi:hypothetical protein